MELRRATTSLLRSQSSPLSSLFIPSTTLRWTAGYQLSAQRASNKSSERNFSTSMIRYATKPTRTTTAAAAPPNNDTTPTTDPKQTAESLGWSRPSITRGNPLGRRRSGSEEDLNHMGTAESILGAMESYTTNNKTSIDLSRLQMGNLGQTPGRDPLLMRGLMSDMTLPKTPRVPIDLKPSAGREVPIRGNIDLGRGFRLLEQSCARNRVRADFTKQRFHERGGMKRKRLRRERWRKRFMEGFKATVGRVKQLKNQGW